MCVHKGTPCAVCGRLTSCNTCLETDIFTLPVAVQPQHQVAAAAPLLLQVAAHLGLAGEGTEGKGRRKEGDTQRLRVEAGHRFHTPATHDDGTGMLES
jgi:hypothetical protein